MFQLILFSTALDFKILDKKIFFNEIHFIIITIFLTFGLCFSEEKKNPCIFDTVSGKGKQTIY